MTIDRSNFVSLERPIDFIGKGIKPAQKSVVLQHQIILSAIKSIRKDYKQILKTFYAAPPKVKGNAFGKLITIWGEKTNPITKEDLKEVEKVLGNNVKFPAPYRNAILKNGLPTFSDEFVSRLQDIKFLDSVTSDVEGDWDVDTNDYMSIKRFLTSKEIIEKTLLISEKTNTPPANVAIAINENGALLCYKGCVKPKPMDPEHFGEPDLIYDLKNDKKIKDSDFDGEFNEWIENYLLIKPLNVCEESVLALKSPIENMLKTINSLFDASEYIENRRYHNAFGKLSNHISELSHLYSQKF